MYEWIIQVRELFYNTTKTQQRNVRKSKCKQMQNKFVDKIIKFVYHVTEMKA